MNSFKHTVNKASEEEIYSHLNACKNLFKPSLDTYVNLFEYANKIKTNAFTFEAWIDNRLCGLVACYLNDKEKLNGHITNVSVLKEEQGKGIAKTLLINAIREFKKKGFKTITLEVEDNNANAIKFYQKLSFTLSTKVANKYSMINRINEDQNIMVSICCITYNHEKFIRQALDGFIMQKASFPIEVLIHDDASTDDTANIIREYEKKYPEIIKPIYQTENQYSKGVGISVTYNFPRAKGKYIAMCEGDDYWTDPLKLQRQVDFLEKNKRHFGIAENAIVHYDNGRQQYFGKKPSRNISIKEIIKGRQFATASILFRNVITIPSYFGGLIAGDTPLMILILQKGPIYYNNTVSSVYRRGAHGVTSSFTNSENLKRLEIYNQRLDEMTEFKYSKYLDYLNYSTKQTQKNNISSSIFKKEKKWLQSKSNSVLCRLFGVKQFFYFDLQKLSFFEKWYYLLLK